MKKAHFSKLIKEFNFETLFNELGWDNFHDSLPKKIGDEIYTLNGVAEKKGFAILHCPPLANRKPPLSAIRKQIEKKVTDSYQEHLIIYTDAAQKQQIWQLVVTEDNKPRQTREVTWHSHQDTEALFQRMKNLLFTLSEEDGLTIVDVKKKVEAGLGKNTDKITNNFYKEFKKQHSSFLSFIEGIDDHIKKDNKNKEWYVSLMLNRLMFCYFIQKKGFLDQNLNYLQDKLAECQKHEGDDNFYGFYRSFLLELFHDALGTPEPNRDKQVTIDMGKIPYLNGGLFDVHELEKQFDKITISDDAFKQIFDFFDQWNWHLDNRAAAEGKDINPDVIGFIFERYINDRSGMGAYYTKEDITDYISKNCIIPYLLDETKRHHAKPFKADGDLWQFLQNSSDLYIYDAVKKGIEEASKDGNYPASMEDLAIPDNIKMGLDAESPNLLERRKDWNTKTPEHLGLPTEIWRETIERWKRYFVVREKIENGELTSINDFITYNLNIRQFIQDYVEYARDADTIREIYKAIRSVTILDPTCGSGAFLFAALNILEPLYEACIVRMEQFTSEAPGKHKFFEEELAKVNSEEHPNLPYFIYKSIIINNLYGVDIMKEAVEIAKLRLFLKLMGTVEVNPRKPNFGLEPLPDIDFNIRAGNTLVGFATEEELLTTIQKHDNLFAQDKLDEFKEESDLVSKAYQRFQDAQLINNQGSDDFKKAKEQLNERLKALNNKLNVYLASNYGIDAKKKPKKYEEWLMSHQPFHWFSDFYQIVAADGGFDVIIGNPPYVEYSKIEKIYSLQNYETQQSGNLYAPCIERSANIQHLNSYLGMIIPLSGIVTPRMKALIEIIQRMNSFVSYYSASAHPSTLFNGVKQRLSIILYKKDESTKQNNTSFLRWSANERNHLFESKITYMASNSKLSSELERSISEKLNKKPKTISDYTTKASKEKVHYHNAPVYWNKVFDFVPYFYSDRDGVKQSVQVKTICTKENCSHKIISTLNSNLFYWYFYSISDCWHLTNREVLGFPIQCSTLPIEEMSRLCLALMRDLKSNSIRYKRSSKDSGSQEFDSFYPAKSKHIIDEIDKELAKHYGFTEEELDFIINYDIKYRMGKALFGEDDGEGEEG
ncbi:Eco57I restriction-modification methylase [Ekhidna lutea]|uniref:site-specific DNA-methyltransferase (adenine-specific) n=1 Tax=Ekhidna lutea TaxID=447679 RepID=A0A239LG25_EKHLU|nr:DNA methyltransferase [Ekhidna lutea]SNT28599.1 Eco57I restriction-modification methylase [Ekhidna lutea]